MRGAVKVLLVMLSNTIEQIKRNMNLKHCVNIQRASLIYYHRRQNIEQLCVV